MSRQLLNMAFTPLSQVCSFSGPPRCTTPGSTVALWFNCMMPLNLSNAPPLWLFQVWLFSNFSFLKAYFRDPKVVHTLLPPLVFKNSLLCASRTFCFYLFWDTALYIVNCIWVPVFLVRSWAFRNQRLDLNCIGIHNLTLVLGLWNTQNNVLWKNEE